MTRDEQVASLELINAELDNRRSVQRDADSRVDTKATLFAGFAVTAAQVLATQHRTGAWLTFAYVSFGVAFALAIVTLFPRKQWEVPSPMSLASKETANQHKGLILAELVGTKAEAIRRNSRRHRLKTYAFRAAAGTLAIALAASMVAIQTEETHVRAEPGASTSGHGPR